MWAALRQLGTWLAALYAAALVLHAASLSALPQRPEWLAFVDTFALALYAPLPLLVVFAALARTRIALLATAIGVALFFGSYGYRFIPRSPAPGQASESFTVLSNNLLANNRHADLAVGTIREEAPDVVALQELSEEMADALRRAFVDVYPFQALEPEWTDGIGVFSRFPIRSSRMISLSENGHPGQRVELEIHGRTVTLLNVHLHSPEVAWYRRRLPFTSFSIPVGYDTSARDGELAALLRELETISGPTVVAGDFNLPERSAGYLWLSGRLVDAYGTAGYGFGHTFPQLGDTFIGPRRLLRRARHLGPFLRIDYIWHSPDLTTLSARVAAPSGSDHRPVVARLAIEPTTVARQPQ